MPDTPLALGPKPALILVDIQTAFDDPFWGNRNNPGAEKNAARLLHAWRAVRAPVFHVRHSSTNPNSTLHASKPGFRLKPEVEPTGDEPVITKSVNSAFIGTDLESRLRDAGIQEVVIAGLTTPHCVSTSTRMAGNLGFDAYVVSDAVAAFDLAGPDGAITDAETIHRISLITLHAEFATIVDTKSVLGAINPA